MGIRTRPSIDGFWYECVECGASYERESQAWECCEDYIEDEYFNDLEIDSNMPDLDI